MDIAASTDYNQLNTDEALFRNLVRMALEDVLARAELPKMKKYDLQNTTTNQLTCSFTASFNDLHKDAFGRNAQRRRSLYAS